MEIVFTDDGWRTLAFVCAGLFVILFIFMEGIGLELFSGEQKYFRQRIRQRSTWIHWGIALAVFYVIAVSIMAAVTHATSRHDGEASSYELAAHFGFESGKEYPLILGDIQGSGIVGDATLEAGLFAAVSTVDLRPTSTVSVGFQKDDNWWQLTLPTSTTTFKKGAEEPTVKITLFNYYIPKSGPAVWRQTWSDCHWQLRNLWVVCQRTIETREFMVTQQGEGEGLANVVSQYFQSAEIRLTDEQHTKLFSIN